MCCQCHVSQNNYEELSVLKVEVEQRYMEVFVNATQSIRHKSIDLLIQHLYWAINLASQSHNPLGQSGSTDWLDC